MEVIKQQNSEWVSEYSANRDFLIRKKKKKQPQSGSWVQTLIQLSSFAMQQEYFNISI